MELHHNKTLTEEFSRTTLELVALTLNKVPSTQLHTVLLRELLMALLNKVIIRTASQANHKTSLVKVLTVRTLTDKIRTETTLTEARTTKDQRLSNFILNP
jgi:hypothetical protein